ncbi:MAG: hypothetical protein MUO99_05910 [Dehalococcoidales bacterium]|nr:hypothetical protein [Dehalococcoidales bacterium]
MLEGYCPKCGTHQIGWALRFARYQTCPKCGAGLVIKEGDQQISQGYSPFTADKYVIKPPSSVPTTEKTGDGGDSLP